MFKLIILMLLGSMVYSVSAMDIESQILKIRSASDNDRYKFVNELKKELSKLSRAERTHAILALKQQMSGSSENSVVALSSASATNIEQNQHSVLDSYQSVAAIDTTIMIDVSKGAVGAEVLDAASTAQVISAQVTPSRPAEVIQPNVVVSVPEQTVATNIPQNSIIQQTIAPTVPINNVASNLSRTSMMQHNMRMISYRI